MSRKLINIRIEIERDLDVELDKWARAEGRSKRRHASILLRRITSLRRTQSEDLERLGLAERIGSNP